MGKTYIKGEIIMSVCKHRAWKTLEDMSFVRVAGTEKELEAAKYLQKQCLDAGVELPCVNGQESLKNIDFNQILMMVESGVVGKLVEIESSEGDTIYITVE